MNFVSKFFSERKREARLRKRQKRTSLIADYAEQVLKQNSRLAITVDMLEDKEHLPQIMAEIAKKVGGNVRVSVFNGLATFYMESEEFDANLKDDDLVLLRIVKE